MEKEEKELLDRFANYIKEKNLVEPALFVLESSKPVSFLASQMLLFLKPFATVFFSEEGYNKLIRILEDRKNIQYLIERLEER